MAEFTISGCYSEYRGGVPRHWLVRFQSNDGGRSRSKRPRQTNDCTVRALALACGIPYDQAYDTLAHAGRKCGRGFQFREWIDAGDTRFAGCRLMWRSFPARKGCSRMNPAKFCEQYPTGRWIVRTAKHVFAIVDGIVLDTHSPRPDRCVYGAWEVTE